MYLFFDWDDRREELSEPTEEMLLIQAERYQGIFEILREHSDVISSVTFWGAADDYTWLDDFPVGGRKNWPFVFAENHQPKESFWRIVDFKADGKAFKQCEKVE
jgi:endo-1,4-beta-xylanase